MKIKLKLAESFRRQSIGSPIRIDILGGGLINTTFKVETVDGKLYIAQKMSDVFTEDTVLNQKVVCDYLLEQNISVPRIISWWKDDMGLWKVTPYIEHDPSIGACHETAIAAARYLGSIHDALKNCPHVPKVTLPDFHNTQVIARKLVLQSSKDSGLSRQIKQECELVVGAIRELQPLEGATMLIHGDPKCANFLFNEYCPLVDEEDDYVVVAALIDWDTVMVGHVLMDLGDMLRSFCRRTDGRFDKTRFRMCVEDYREHTHLGYSDEEVLDATRLITLELAARFLIDFFEDSYFSFDPSKFRSRREANLASVRKYINYFQSM